jgi:hypothetical protein
MCARPGTALGAGTDSGTGATSRSGAARDAVHTADTPHPADAKDATGAADTPHPADAVNAADTTGAADATVVSAVNAADSPDADAVNAADTTDSTDADALRRALRDAATGIRPSPWPGGAVIERARRARRTRRLTVALSAAAVVAAAGGGVVATQGRGAGGPGRPAGPAAAPSARGLPATRTAEHTAIPAPARPSTPAVRWPAVRVVRAGEVVDLGKGARLRLEPTHRCVDTSGLWECKSTADGNQAQDSVSLQSVGDASGTLYTPLYVGHGTAARMSVTVRGRVYPLQVVTLPGRPGYATAYGRAPSGAPARSGPAFDGAVVTVYDAQGKVLASLP